MKCPIDPNLFMQITGPLLRSGDVTQLARQVSVRWRCRDVAMLLDHQQVNVRRVAAVTLGLVGDMTNSPALARALRDADDQVTQLAEHSLWSIWFRCGCCQASEPFRHGVAMLAAEDYRQALELFTQAIAVDGGFAEAYHQRSVAHFLLGNCCRSMADARRTLCLNPHHFAAHCGMGHSLMRMGELAQAMGCYRRALRIHPRLESIPQLVAQLQAAIESQALADPPVMDAIGHDPNQATGMFLIDPCVGQP